MNLYIAKNIEKLRINKHNGDFQCLYAPIILVDSIYRKYENYYPKVFSERHYFIEDTEICFNNSDEEYYDEECINLFLKSL